VVSGNGSDRSGPFFFLRFPIQHLLDPLLGLGQQYRELIRRSIQLGIQFVHQPGQLDSEGDFIQLTVELNYIRFGFQRVEFSGKARPGRGLPPISPTRF
jgi:hypothetical protein